MPCFNNKNYLLFEYLAQGNQLYLKRRFPFRQIWESGTAALLVTKKQQEW